MARTTGQTVGMVTKIMKREKKDVLIHKVSMTSLCEGIFNSCLLIGRYHFDSILIAAFVAPRLEFIILG